MTQLKHTARFTIEQITPAGAFCTNHTALNFYEAQTLLAANPSYRIYGAGDRKDFQNLQSKQA